VGVVTELDFSNVSRKPQASRRWSLLNSISKAQFSGSIKQEKIEV
jgi:hypothetical protein